MNRTVIAVLLAACLTTPGCVHLFFWAGERKLTPPPEP